MCEEQARSPPLGSLWHALLGAKATIPLPPVRSSAEHSMTPLGCANACPLWGVMLLDPSRLIIPPKTSLFWRVIQGSCEQNDMINILAGLRWQWKEVSGQEGAAGGKEMAGT